MRTLKIQPNFSNFMHVYGNTRHSHLKELKKYGKYSHLRYISEKNSHLHSGALFYCSSVSFIATRKDEFGLEAYVM